MAFLQRTHTCGELREEHEGQTVVLNGWVNTERNQKHFVFVDLRDRYGLTQVVFEPERGEELFKQAQQVRSEWVLAIKGEVTHRAGKENPRLATGAIEVKATELQVLNRCPTPPFEIAEKPSDEDKVTDRETSEDLRLRHRYLDLRRMRLQSILQLRHRMSKVIRDYLDTKNFLELETPLLGKSTPEGARDYLVPSRLVCGEWYALPQSPQLYKQLLMIAGYDRYFQVARCLRDEDLRADRQPEFTQLDIEMSFVEMEDIFSLMEGLTVAIFKECLGVTIETPLPRLSYEDVMRDYGTDKPDLRYEMKIVDLTDLAEKIEFIDFQNAVQNKGTVRAINVKGGMNPKHGIKRKTLDNLVQMFNGTFDGKTCYAKYAEGKFAIGIAKFLEPVAEELVSRLNVEENDLIFFGSGNDTEEVLGGLGNMRCHFAEEVLKLVSPDVKDFKPLWVVDFPSFFWDDEESRWVANHHPFTSPRDEDLENLESDPPSVRAKAYDLVINGYEVGGGSIRIHDQSVQQRVFALLGMQEAEANERFGFLLNALKHGAPPHGGIALGLDRWAMILGGTTNIRDVIAFPKNQRARDLMTGAPAPVDEHQLQELGIQFVQEPETEA